MARGKKREIKICVVDFETDPFLYGRNPEPFAAGFFDGESYKEFWGDDCHEQLMRYLCTRKNDDLLIYAHNGGKFDFFFLLDYICNPIFMINGRIVECKLETGHALRDSYSILPMPLAAYQKEEIDYKWFERHEREKYKNKILDYLKADCVYLHELVQAFADRFTGQRQKMPPLTIGSTALRELRKIHPQRLESSEEHDNKFRDYFFGGRVQCFKTGVIDDDLQIVDVNSMYPGVMKNYSHPFGTKYIKPHKIQFTKDGEIKGFEGCVFFIHFSGVTFNVPYRNKDGGIDFDTYSGESHLVSHEFKLAYSKGFIEIHEIFDVSVCTHTQTFGEFVDKFADEKIEAKTSGDTIKEIFAKLIMNSSYGKFAQNPRKFRDFYIEKLGVDLSPDGEEWACTGGDGESFRIWEKPVEEMKFNDVAVAASITSAARTVLLHALLDSDGVVYCDTDSMIFRSLGKSVEIHDSKLGAWKFEGRGQRAIIAGKKMYSVLADPESDYGRTYTEKMKKKGKRVETHDGMIVIKKASKGAKLSAAQMERMVRGESIEYRIDAPAFSLKRGVTFTVRNIRKTA